MEYKDITLFALGCLGIFIHLLMKINDINRQRKGNWKFRAFIKLEWPTVLLSIAVVGVLVMAKKELMNIEEIQGKFRLLAVAVGYMADSVVYFFAGKARKIMDVE